MKSDENDSDQPQVLEYYKNYSQNRELPKYFCGTSVPFKKQEQDKSPGKPLSENTPRPALVGQDNIVIPQIEINEIVDENARISSPTSSVTSTKKLEWDNGADIGYMNASKLIQKSVSLPILSTLERAEIRRPLLRLSPEGNNDGTTHVLVQKSSSSDSSHQSTNAKIYSSSSSVTGNVDNKFNTSGSSSSFEKKPVVILERKIGLPVAHSSPFDVADIDYPNYITTPRYSTKERKKTIAKTNLQCLNINPDPDQENSELRSSRLSNSYENLSMVHIEQTIKTKWNSNVDLSPNSMKNRPKLSVSKPVVVECKLAYTKQSVDEIIQTTLTKQCTASVQTDFLQPNRGKVDKSKNRSDCQKTLFLYHSSNRNSKSSTSSTHTSSTNCNSFEYLFAEDYNRSINIPQEERLSDNGRRLLMERYLGNNERKSDSNRTDAGFSTSGDSVNPKILANLSSKQPKNRHMNVERGSEIFNKLYRSKKYDKNTKKYYLKKILEKMIDSLCSDESSQSENYMKSSTTSGSTDINSIKGKVGTEANLQENKPWKPFKDDVYTKNVGSVNTAATKFSCIMAENNQSGTHNKKSKFTLPNSPIKEVLSVFQKDEDIDNNIENIKVAIENVNLNSERSLQQPESGDCVKSNEKEQLLKWIDQQIYQLNKLKINLEDPAAKTFKKKSEKLLETPLTKPHVDDMKGIQKSTAVYMMSAQRTCCDDNDNSEQECFQRNDSDNSCCVQHSEICQQRTRICKEEKRPCQSKGRTSCGTNTKPLRCSKKFVEVVCDRPTVFHWENDDLVKNAKDKRKQSDKEGNINKGLSEPNEKSNHTSPEIEIVISSSNENVDSERRIPETRKNVTKASEICEPQLIEISSPERMQSPVYSLPSEPPRKYYYCTELSTGSSSSCHCNHVKAKHNIPVICKDFDPSSSSCCYCNKIKENSSSSINIQVDKTELPVTLEFETKSTKCKCKPQSEKAPKCTCCKSKRVLKTPCDCGKPEQDSNRFCSSCYTHWIRFPTHCRPCYASHVCQCYNNYANSNQLEEIKRTIKEIADLEDRYCVCAKDSTSTDCCSYCKKRIKCKRTKNKKNYGYLLTLKPGTPEEKVSQEKIVRPLEEVVVKVPDFEYYKRRSRNSKSTDSEKNPSCNCEEKSHKKYQSTTLQDYLCINRPKFIESAEERRKRIIDLAIMREKRCQKYKQLLAMSEGNRFDHSKFPKPIIFTSKEMKAITAKNYKKLPEVQQKLIDRRETNVRKANRMLANMFNKRIRDLALKGTVDLSISTSVIKFG